MTTLRSKLLLSYSLTVAGTVGLVLVVGFFLVRGQLLRGSDFLLNAEFKEIEPKLLKGPTEYTEKGVSAALLDHVTIDAAFYFFQVHDEHGRILFRSPNLGEKILPDLTPAKLDYHTIELNGLGLIRMGEYHAGPFHVQIATSLNYLTNLSRRFYRNLIMGIPAVLLISSAVGWCLGEIFLRPLRLIEQTARRISVSNLRERIPVGQSKDEITRLSALLNEMFDRLERSFEQIKEFTADMSHELRTPLSIVALHTEKLLKRPNLDRESVMALQEVLTETKRLDYIIDQLLVLAKAEAQALPLAIAPHSTIQFVEEFAQDATALAEASGKRFVLQRNEDLCVQFDQSWIRQVFFNLLSNAIKMSPPGGKIEFESCRQNGSWCTSMTDEGPGIAPGERQNVFERFKQLRHPGTETKGAGLGLAVCKSVVELHGGTIAVESAPGRSGANIVVKIPIECSGGEIERGL